MCEGTLRAIVTGPLTQVVLFASLTSCSCLEEVGAEFRLQLAMEASLERTPVGIWLLQPLCTFRAHVPGVERQSSRHLGNFRLGSQFCNISCRPLDKHHGFPASQYSSYDGRRIYMEATGKHYLA